MAADPYKNWRRFQPSRAAKPRDLREPDDSEPDCDSGEVVCPSGKKKQRNLRGKPARAKPTSVLDNPEDTVLRQAHSGSSENDVARAGADIADGPVLSGDSYRDALFECPVTPEGMDKLCRTIQQRITCIQKAHDLQTSADIKNMSITEMMGIANSSSKPGFGKQVGMFVNFETADLLDKSLLSDDSKHKAIKLEEKDSLEQLGFGFLGVLASYNSECSIDLLDFHKKVRCVNYDPTFINCAVVNFPCSDARALVFANGKLVFPGVTNINGVWIAARNTLELLLRCGFKPVIKKDKLLIHNVTGMLDVEAHIDIEGFHLEYKKFTHYNSDVFCAVTYFPELPETGKSLGVCYQIFSTGKILTVGGKNERTITDQLVHLSEMLLPFIRDKNNGLKDELDSKAA